MFFFYPCHVTCPSDDTCSCEDVCVWDHVFTREYHGFGWCLFGVSAVFDSWFTCSGQNGERRPCRPSALSKCCLVASTFFLSLPKTGLASARMLHSTCSVKQSGVWLVTQLSRCMLAHDFYLLVLTVKQKLSQFLKMWLVHCCIKITFGVAVDSAVISKKEFSQHG